MKRLAKLPVATAEAQSAVTVAELDPFPLHDDPNDIGGARFHVRDAYESYLKKPHDDGFASLISLRECIQHHPGLKAEARALQLMVEGYHAVCKLDNRHTYATEEDEGFTAAEVWLLNHLNSEKEVTTDAFMLQLGGSVSEKLRKNPESVALADAIDGMFEARQTMWKLSMWLKSL